MAEISSKLIRLPEPGAVWGDYEILSRLGQGGMAEVWLASVRGAHGFRKKVVVKTMSPERAATRSLLQMFVREASLAAQLSHPGLVQVHRFGEVDDVPFIEMEYVAGCSLRELTKKLGARPGQSATVGLRAIASGCDALHYLHTFCDESGRALGLVHRDVSPENLMIAFTGHTKLLDFGIITPTSVPHRTIVGSVKGKYAYMAPEVLRGEADTPQRDLYAIGVILYELAVGHRPFRAKNEAELVWRITNERPRPPHVENPHCPRELSALIMAAMAPVPEDRPGSADELGRRLRRILQSIDELEVEHADLAVEVASLFPERSDIPGAIRSKLSGIRPAPFSARPATADLELLDEDEYEEALEPPLLDDDLVHEAERCFERGLERVREGLYEAALTEWERALQLDPHERRYAANLKTLRERIARERSR